MYFSTISLSNGAVFVDDNRSAVHLAAMTTVDILTVSSCVPKLNGVAGLIPVIDLVDWGWGMLNCSLTVLPWFN